MRNTNTVISSATEFTITKYLLYQQAANRNAVLEIVRRSPAQKQKMITWLLVYMAISKKKKAFLKKRSVQRLGLQKDGFD